ALSVVAALDRQVLFVGPGERLDALETFHPDRIASRTLGMGDVLTLVERAQEKVSTKQASEMERRLRRADITLEDFTRQLRQIRAMGPLDQVLGMIARLGPRMRGMSVDERALGRIEAMVSSMTPDERRRPQVIDGSRRRRIARGSGTLVPDV